MSNFREFDRETGFLLPPSLDEWLPEQHLARFVVMLLITASVWPSTSSLRSAEGVSQKPK